MNDTKTKRSDKATLSSFLKNERTNALKEVKRLCKEYGFTTGMLKGSFARGRGENARYDS